MSLIKTNAIQTLAGKPILNATGSVLQVKSVTKTDTFSFTTSGTQSGIDITGMSLAITPSATSSKILILLQCAIVGSNAGQGIKVLRGSSAIAIGDSSGSNKLRVGIIGMYGSTSSNNLYSNGSNHLNFLDSPNTTNATTYKLQATGDQGTFYVNRTIFDTDNAYAMRNISTLTLMEIAG